MIAIVLIPYTLGRNQISQTDITAIIVGEREGAGRELREFRVWPRFNHRPVGNRTDCRLAQFLVYNVCSGYNGIPTLDGTDHFYSGTSTIIMYEIK